MGATPGWFRMAALAQGQVLALALLICLVVPRPGGAVLLVPLRQPEASVLAGLPDLVVLRAGAIPGSVLVQWHGTVPVLALLRRGVLPLGAPGWACRTPFSRARAPDRTG